ncbi:MAG: hypothetical protein ACO4AJ_12505, partial [Prochlorothrix sp.]
DLGLLIQRQSQTAIPKHQAPKHQAPKHQAPKHQHPIEVPRSVLQIRWRDRPPQIFQNNTE